MATRRQSPPAKEEIPSYETRKDLTQYEHNPRNIPARLYDRVLVAAIGFLVGLVCSRRGPEALRGRGAAVAGRNANGALGAAQPSSGWSQINVFHGDMKHFKEKYTWLESAGGWYSQAGQDKLILDLLKYKRNGYFIDLAANNAASMSNSFAMEQHYGWNGLCIEPNPQYWEYLAYRRCDVVAALVGGKTKDEVQVSFNGVVGGIVGDKFDNKKAEKTVNRYTVSLQDVFEKFNTPSVIDYMSLDVEGAEELVMATFPYDRYMFRLMTVERPSENLRQILKGNGYVCLKTLEDWGETLWAHKSFVDDSILAKFSDTVEE